MDLQNRSEDMETRKRRLRYRAWHRGMREMDLVLGRFADAELGGMAEPDVSRFEALMGVPDPDLLAWVLGQAPVPPEHDTPLFRRLAGFHRGDHQ
jgi:antitoxin CptB